MFERVYAVFLFHDQPQRGVAACQGEPYFYDREFDKDADEFSDTYVLTPIDKRTLALVLKEQKLWLEIKPTLGKNPAKHPFFGVVSPERAKYAKSFERRRIIDARIAAIKAGKKQAKARFRVHPDSTAALMAQADQLEVEWREIKNMV